MRNFKIARLLVKNFKSYTEEFCFDFSCQDLIILDGPNGFGKTTIFDAIEIALTGTISRFKDSKNIDSKTRNKNMLISTNGMVGDPAFIVLELIDNGTSLIIGTYIEAKKGLNKEWSSHISRVLLNFWPSNVSDIISEVSKHKHEIEEQSQEQSQEQLQEELQLQLQLQLQGKLNYKELAKLFTVFNYIQQEESLHFIKLDEKSRFKQINHLFGVENEKKALTKLENLKAAINGKLSIIRGEKKEKEIQLENIKADSGETNVVTLSGNTISPIVPGTVTIEKLEKYKGALIQCRYILSDDGKSDWLLIKKRHKVRLLLKHENKKIIKNLLIFSKVSDFSYIESLGEHIVWVTNTINKCNDYSVLKNLDVTEGVSITNELLNSIRKYFSKAYKKNKVNVNSYNALLNTQSTTERLLASIKKSSETLIESFNKYHDEEEELIELSGHKEVDCPLCGQSYADLIELNKLYKKQQAVFEELKTDAGKMVELAYDKVLDELILPVIQRSKLRYEKYSYYDESYKEELRKRQISKDSFNEMLEIKSWFDDHLDKYNDYVCHGLFCVDYPVESKYDEIKRILEGLDSELSTKVNDDFESIKSELDFIGVDANVESHEWPFTIDNIANDILYVENIIKLTKNTEYKQVLGELNVHEKDLSNYNNLLEAISDGCDIYKDSISRHEKDIAKKIQIPFYNISSKILQTRLESGLPASGVILDAPDKLNNNGYYRFCSSISTEHDAWSTMSSGQLAGVIIAFMLVMNKVFPTGLKVLLIDDPIQSMDDINMASFVQLLREEFTDYQIIVSTHESRIANYVSYKYKSSGLNYLAINLKDEKKKRAVIL